jgi:hypothetical protein
VPSRHNRRRSRQLTVLPRSASARRHQRRGIIVPLETVSMCGQRLHRRAPTTLSVSVTGKRSSR